MPAGHVHAERLAHGAPSPAFALVAGLLRDLALAAADVAGLLAHQLAERRPADGAQAAGAAAALAGVDRRARLGAVAVAVLAGVHELVGHLGLHPARRLLERDLDLHRLVAALHAARSAAEAAAEGVTAEERVEDVGERAEAVGLGGEAARLEAVEAVAVVGCPALGVGEDLVRLSGLLELLLGLGVVVVDVGVELAGQPPEGRLDLPIVSLTADSQDLVGVAPHSS